MLVPAPLSMVALLAAPTPETRPAGTRLLRRGESASQVLYLERGRVVLGVLGQVSAQGALLEHQLGAQTAPGWLDATAAVLNLPAAMDAVAETEVQLRAVPLATFQAALAEARNPVASVLADMAQAHRQQTELAVSRLSKDAEARCAEWLLNQAERSKVGDGGVCTVLLQQRKRLIAAQLGIAPETLSRVLRHLRERSLISGSGRVVQLVDTQGLRALAGV
ncbi:Crp/Fnr family transcriptional regulator [Rhodoferax saidenbachensis]|uniref:CRP-like cAMP-binding protein n=1 Tax=Rhodoferax saidenbachensis TaxID=1484693 RepID=A0ABU1ZRT3_9BURK|nr:Crp/Fnr family transcriptional regulator [Rhodoferax saidenbachensis]MDR7308242.1 CRP-like cAMP-binding protein [Rhodoferax saidenbachensis]